MANSRAQSAMQYIITYGWMILVVAAVITILFYLGVLIPPTGARAPPGSCHVLRPNGPGSNQFMSLAGVCISELPQYVLILPAASSTNAVEITDPAFFSSLGGPNFQMTITFWVYGEDWPYIVGGGIFIPIVTRKEQFGACVGGGKNRIELKDGYDDTGPIAAFPVANDTWYFMADTVNVSDGVNTINLYVNATPVIAHNTHGGEWESLSDPTLQNGQPSPLFIGGQTFSSVGACGGSNEVIDGYLANVQIYNISLSQNAVQELYVEGIGGAPVELPNLVGWWPLNGNLNDYSGNNNNGTMGGVTPSFNNQWIQDTGYAPP